MIQNGDCVRTKHLFCFGFGYVCDHLAQALIRDNPGEGVRIYGTTRDIEKRAALRARGITASLFDFGVPLPDPLYMLRDITHILISTPPTNNGDPTFIAHAHDILGLPHLEWVGYLSTTGIYGDRAGGAVDETTYPRPSTQRGSRRLKAEEQWLSLFHSHRLPVHIFRLAGIYGPGRSALDSVRMGNARRIDKPGHAFSRMHVEDIVQVLMASINAPKPGEIYNLCDDMPAPSHDVIDYACQLLGMDSPPLIPIETADLAPITQSFYADNKRVSNAKIKSDLGVTLKYESYKEGLRACLEEERQTEKNIRTC